MTRHFKPVYAGISFLIILSGSSAIAREPENIKTENPKTVKLNAVTVVGDKNTEPLTANSTENSEIELKRVAGATSIVTKSDYDKERSANLKDVLEFVPGVLVQTRYGEESRLAIRGSGLSRTFHLRGIKLLQDGIPMNLADGGADFQEIDSSAYDHIEVYKGANALRYGANTLGGAINFVTSTGYNADKFRTGMDYGSYDTRKNFISSGGVYGAADYFINLSNFYTRGYRQHSDQNNTKLFTNIGYRFNPNLETRVYFTYADINQELPGNLTKLQAESNPRQAAAGNLSGDQQRDYFLYRLASKTTYKEESFETNFGLYTVHKDLYHPIFQVLDQQSADYGTFADTTFFGNISGLENELLIGANISTGRLDAKQFVNNGGISGAQTNFNLQKSNNLDVYTENTLKATDDLSLITGAQIVYAQRNYGDYFLTDGDRSAEKFYKGLSPKIGLLYDLSAETQLFTNYSWAYEPPTFSELTQALPGVSGLADIEAQRSQTFEIGTRGEKFNINWEAAWYYAWLKDELLTYSLGGPTTGTLNADKTVHTGVELGLNAVVANDILEASDDVKIRFSYTYNDFKFDEDAQWGNNAIPGAPDHFMIAEIKYEHPSGFYIAPNFEASPDKYPVDMANSLYADPYAIIGLKAGYDVTKDVTLFMDARNLLNKNYVATTGIITAPTVSNTNQFTPGDGRSVYFGLRYKFN